MAFKDWYENPKYEAGEGKSYWSSWSKWSYLDDPFDNFDKEDKRDKDKNKRTCEDALRSVSRSANVILNSGSQERQLAVKFSGGDDVNTLKDDTIYLSPDALLACATRADKEDIIDSMSGQAMLAAQLKRQLDPATYQEFLLSKDPEIRSLWSAIELAIARGEVISDWAGFKPYFDLYAKTSSKVSSTVIKRELSKFNGSSEDKPTSAKAFVMGLAWNLYHSHDPIRIPPAYNDGKMLVAAGLRGAETCADRWTFCSLVVAELRRMYDKTPPKGKGPVGLEGRPKDFDEESGEGVDLVSLLKQLEKIKKEEEPGAVKKGPPKKGADKFTGIDEELFGTDRVTNKKCKEAGEIDAITGDSTSELKDSVSAPSIPGGPGGYRGRSVKRGIPFWLSKDLPSKDSKRHFDRAKIDELKKIAETIKDSFGFTDKLAKRKVYGLKAGVIRPEALYRLELGSDEVFYKTTMVDIDKVSVCLLIDQSGSMGSHSNGSAAEKVVEAAEVAYVLAHLCKDIKHMDLSVMGFSAQESCSEARLKLSGSDCDGEVNMRLIYDSIDPLNNNIEDICHIRAHANNLDGFSLWYAAKHMAESRAERKRKVLIVVSDGSPNGRGYGGEEAEEHVALCKKDVKARFGIDTYAIGISNAYTQHEGDKMYGAGNNIIIGDVKSSVGFLSRFLNQVSQIA